MRTMIGRFLVFRTSMLPKKIGVPIRRVGRRILFKKKPALTRAQAHSSIS